MKSLLEKFNLLNINGYEFISPLNGGNMSSAAIYKNKNGNKSVVKFLLYPRNNFELIRFKKEFEAMKNVNDFNDNKCSVNLLSKLEKVEDADIYFFMMNFIEGKTLEQYFNEYTLPWDSKDSTKMLLRIATALSKSLSIGILHKDIHGGNIIITGDDYKLGNDDPNLLIIDFGVSEIWYMSFLEDGIYGDNFRHNGALSTWSPESLNNSSNLKPSHDIWALGSLYFKMLTGKWAFDGESFGEYYEKIVTGYYNKTLLKELNIDDFSIYLLDRIFQVNPEHRVSLQNLTKLCLDYLNGTIESLQNDKIVLDKYLKADGDLWICPNCFCITTPFGTRCTNCGRTVDEYLPLNS